MGCDCVPASCLLSHLRSLRRCGRNGGVLDVVAREQGHERSVGISLRERECGVEVGFQESLRVCVGGGHEGEREVEDPWARRWSADEIESNRTRLEKHETKRNDDRTKERKDKHFPFGHDMVPSPVTRAVAAASEEPAPVGREEGGKTRTAASRAGEDGGGSGMDASSLAASSKGVGSSSEGAAGAGTPRESGRSMMAIQRATAYVGEAAENGPEGDGGRGTAVAPDGE